jgi:TonB-dependent starch-binding outer membrane protein SusC
MYLQIKRVALALCLSLICCIANAQQKVTGTVKDVNGEPLIGVSIALDEKIVAISDIDGNFTIPNAKPSSKLKVSYIGYKTFFETIGNNPHLNIVMSVNNKTLNEVVVVGYGTMKKSDLTGSVSSVNTSQLNSRSATSVLGDLQGANPGVNITQTSSRPGDNFNIEIRGKSSINSSTKPLYVVDGVMCSDINFLNPQDIERIDVLKDASSTAIYGSRATAGVIIVTTKSGSNVAKNQKPSISYDGYYGWSHVTRMPDFMDGNQFYEYRFLKFLTYGGSGDQVNPADPIYQMSGTDMERGLLRQHTGSGNYIMKQMMASGKTYDWPSLVTRNGSQENHFIALNGGSNNIQYHFGLGYNKENGIYKEDHEERINFKGSVDARINKVLSAGFNINLAKINNGYANDAAIQYAYRMNPFMVPYDTNGNINHKPGNYAALGTDSYQFTDQLNPLDVMKSTTKKRDTWRLLGNVYLNFNLLKGLTFKTTFSPNYTYYREGFFGGNINPVTGMAYDDGTYADANKDGLVDNEANLLTNHNFSWTWDNIINYTTTFLNVHKLSLMGLFSMQSGNTTKEYWDATDVMENTNWWNLNSGEYNAKNSYNSYTENSMISYALRANYSYKDRYLFTGTVRWDGSSKFAKDNRWGCFPSAAVAWRITEEPFMKDVNWLNNLKLRFAFGMTGNNDGIGDYATQQVLEGPIYYPFGNVYSTGFYPSGIVNPNLKWEKSSEYNLGLDFGFLDSRIYGTVDVYRKTSKDLLYPVALPLESGGGTMVTNIGSVRNQGIEISLTTINITNKDWHWETTFNFAHNQNKVLEINGTGDEAISSGTTTGSLFVGKPVDNVYAYKFGGIVSDKDMTVPNNTATTKAGLKPGSTMKEYDYYYKVYGLTEGQPYVVDVNGDGKIDNHDRIVKSMDPAFTASLTSNLKWKNWDFNFSIYAKEHYTVYSNFLSEYINLKDRGRMKINGNFYIPAGTILDCDGVNADGTYINPVYQVSTHYGSLPFPNNGGKNGGVGLESNYWDIAKCVTSASYWKVQNITLGYTFPKNWINKFGCSYLRLYFTVTNPFIITPYKGFDPEWANTSMKNDGPSTVTYQIGASIKF